VFTGIIEGMGEVLAAVPGDQGVRLTLGLPEGLDGLEIGGSLAVEGACLTLVEVGARRATCQAIAETLRRTTLAGLRPGSRVNLERPLVAGGRMEGHWVQGHVDGRARLEERQLQGDSERLAFGLLEPALGRYLAAKGSIALAGVSLTVGEVEGHRFTVYVIPHTLAVTTLGGRQPGDEVNVEVDILAKYIERLIQNAPGLGTRPSPAPDASRVDLEAYLRRGSGPHGS
jgi:riboflavin synthase